VVDWSELVAPGVRALEPLDVQSTVEQVRVLGAHEQATRLDWNESPFGPLPGVLDALGDELANVSRYPIEAYDDFRADAARSLGVSSDCVVPGHGTQALICTVATTLLQPGDAVVQPAVTFYLYRMVSVARGAVVYETPMGARGIDLEALLAKAREVDAKLLWICDPNNPTGTALERREWEAFLDALPERCVVVADEAYMDFLPPDRQLRRERDVVDGKPLVVLRSFSKFFGLAGLRLGCAIADEALAGYLRVVDEPFNVNCVALAAGRASLRVGDEVRAIRLREVADAREYLTEALVAVGAEPYPSEVSFVLVRVDADDVLLTRQLLDAGILVRSGSELGLPGHIRVTVGPPSVTDRLAVELGRALYR
jgi:histidinol-phosphate aminotransferase